MFQNILVPLDGSAEAETALKCAGCLAARLGSRVALLHVIESRPPEAVHGQPHLRNEPEAEAYLTAAAARLLPPQVPRTTHVHPGGTAHVALAIARHRAEWGSDLVVITPHGGAGWRGWILGTLPQRVAKQTPCPVLIARAAFCDAEGCPFGRVIIPDDAGTEHEPGWPICVELAALFRAEVHLAAVVETVASLGGAGGPLASLQPNAMRQLLELREREVTLHLRKHMETLGQKGVPAQSHLLRGAPVPEVLRLARELRAGLVVLRTHARAGLGARVEGSFAAQFVADAPVSVLLIPLAGDGAETEESP